MRQLKYAKLCTTIVCRNDKLLFAAKNRTQLQLEFVNNNIQWKSRSDNLLQCNRAGFSDEALQKPIIALFCELKIVFSTTDTVDQVPALLMDMNSTHIVFISIAMKATMTLEVCPFTNEVSHMPLYNLSSNGQMKKYSICKSKQKICCV